MRRAVVLGITAVALAGCAATRQLYPGARRPANEVGALRSGEISQGPSTNQFYANTVDGKSAVRAGDNVRGYPTVELLPGRHEVAIGMYGTGVFTTSYSVRDCVLSLNVQPGHTYVIEGNLRQRNWHAWTRDEATNEIVYCEFPGVPIADGSDADGWRPPCPYGQERVVGVPDAALLEFENSASVRLTGIAPTSGEPGADRDPFKIVGQCVRVQLQRGTSTDRGTLDPGARVGSYVYLGDDSFLNLMLIEGGYAAVDTTVAHRYRAQFDAAQAAARAQRRGLWATHSDTSSR